MGTAHLKRVAIIQARMSSTRLPGKALKLLAGKPVIWHVVHRLAQCATIDEIVLATSNDPSDDPLADYCTALGVRVVRGPLDNVLQRYVMAAQASQADLVLRVTGDAPLIDPATIDRLVRALIESSADYCGIDPAFHHIHEGIEPFTRAALDRVAEVGANDPASIEHVSPMMKSRPDLFRIALVDSAESERIEDVRTSVDTQPDLDFLEALYAQTGAAPGDIDVREVVALLRAHPELLEINRHVRQKTATEKTRIAVFRCDGGSVRGMGHVRRCISVARELAERHSVGVRFALEGDRSAADAIRAAGFGVAPIAPGEAGSDDLRALIASLGPDLLVCDTRSELSRDTLEELKSQGVIIAVIDDGSARRLAADLAFYPPMPQARRLGWGDARTRVFIGWEWVALGIKVAEERTRYGASAPRVLVSMGGADPLRLAPKVAQALAYLSTTAEFVFVVGPAVADPERYADAIAAALPQARIVSDVTDMTPLLAAANLAILAFGVTAYEAAALGVPSAIVSLDEDHLESSAAFVEAGVAVSLGLAADIEVSTLADLLPSVMDPGRLHQMASRTAGLLDGKGARRIADTLVEVCVSRGQ